ncbi:hypothetical protein OA959_00145 [SAR86 cluster bacterium]|nr:hypothetical protein [SAR86 cluster bacterium]
MRKIYSVLLLLIIISYPVASKTVVSCEAVAAWGDHDSLDYNIHPKIFPTIIIDEDSKNITYVYSQFDMKWENEFKITYQNDNNLIGIGEFSATEIKMIHYEVNTGKFNIFFSGGELINFSNTMTAGRCFK